MNNESLILFIKRLLENGSPQKSAMSLKQLREILEIQNANPIMIKLINDTIDSIPEAKSAANEPNFTEESLKIAIKRAENRKRSEAILAERGRC